MSQILPDKREEALAIEDLMLYTPFPTPVRGAVLRRYSKEVKASDDADISQDQLVDYWLGLILAEKTGSRVALTGYIAYLTLLIRLTNSFLNGSVSGTIFTALLFDWSRRCSRFASQCGFSLGPTFDHLVNTVDRYPELEVEKGLEGMLDDPHLRMVGEKVLASLKDLWSETKKKLLDTA